ncbi:transcription factor HAP4 KNAG_0A06430 [Huiozyma naganishii CBS 8797]|uniref:Hap4 transcription factor heteromerisation domain-containing protein n=1 Tax=Huiozyma naganishii (strain ATCC MYA-139 / BCRC 22969 / CBS 8797 / KCTC 17520 / NBRC 10181 / NCYC 3082 / Yp74L-3) TaxID=1071383 RepID=J7S3Z9_HUIN7|nr:hypothetical protein KNAG_0A06430 [Kazachstania naganishii CBS 8797]CCK68301.1 hypothetical protein KNAG_0A06430 [Kazachstania naganishii CBS 8797]
MTLTTLLRPNSKASYKRTHYTPLIPKKSGLQLDNTTTCANTTASTPHHASMVVRTSKRWILPPRPRPGRKTVSSCTANSGTNLVNNTHLLKKRSHSIHTSTPANNNSTSATHTKKRNSAVGKLAATGAFAPAPELNYLAFLKFDEDAAQTPTDTCAAAATNATQAVKRDSVVTRIGSPMATMVCPSPRALTKQHYDGPELSTSSSLSASTIASPVDSSQLEATGASKKSVASSIATAADLGSLDFQKFSDFPQPEALEPGLDTELDTATGTSKKSTTISGSSCPATTTATAKRPQKIHWTRSQADPAAATTSTSHRPSRN